MKHVPADEIFPSYPVQENERLAISVAERGDERQSDERRFDRRSIPMILKIISDRANVVDAGPTPVHELGRRRADH
jgi:hypothetical protein